MCIRDRIGTRHGEKKYESLLSSEEMSSAIESENYFRIPPDLRDLNYEKYMEVGEEKITNSTEYSSNNTTRLDLIAMKKLLLSLDFIKSSIRGEEIEPEA